MRSAPPGGLVPDPGGHPAPGRGPSGAVGAAGGPPVRGPPRPGSPSVRSSAWSSPPPNRSGHASTKKTLKAMINTAAALRGHPSWDLSRPPPSPCRATWPAGPEPAGRGRRLRGQLRVVKAWRPRPAGPARRPVRSWPPSSCVAVPYRPILPGPLRDARGNPPIEATSVRSSTATAQPLRRQTTHAPCTPSRSTRNTPPPTRTTPATPAHPRKSAVASSATSPDIFHFSPLPTPGEPTGHR